MPGEPMPSPRVRVWSLSSELRKPEFKPYAWGKPEMTRPNTHYTSKAIQRSMRILRRFRCILEQPPQERKIDWATEAFLMTEEVYATPRKPLTPRQRLKMWEAHGGCCVVCHRRIMETTWVDEHIVPLGLGGTNDLTNRGPAHVKCAGEKTKEDMARINKAKDQKSRHVGATRPAGTIKSPGFASPPPKDRTLTKTTPGPPAMARRFLNTSAS